MRPGIQENNEMHQSGTDRKNIRIEKKVALKNKL